jgi:hypothetical protein
MSSCKAELFWVDFIEVPGDLSKRQVFFRRARERIKEK